MIILNLTRHLNPAASDKSGGLGGYDIWFSVWVAGPVNVEDAAPQSFVLSANEPNPFSPNTTIRFHLRRPEDVRLTIYDTAGRRVRTLLDGAFLPGETSVEWDGRDAAGHPLASGIYLYRLEAGAESQTRKLTLLR